MHIIAIAWGFVVVLMAAAEATAPQGSLLGAFFILVGYGVLPLAVLLYILGTPMRRRARQAAEDSAQPDRSGMPPGDPLAPEREEA